MGSESGYVYVHAFDLDHPDIPIASYKKSLDGPISTVLLVHVDNDLNLLCGGLIGYISRFPLYLIRSSLYSYSYTRIR